MRYHIIVKPRAKKEANKIPAQFYQRIYGAIKNLSSRPYLGKKLEGDYLGYYSIRIWPYRTIYYISKRERLIIVVRIGHRQGIY